MKNYEKPIAVVSKFEVEDIITNSMLKATSEEFNTVAGSYADGKTGYFLDWVD